MATEMRINGKTVTITQLQRRSIGQPGGGHSEEWRISALVSGLPEHRAFLDLLSQRPLRLEMPNSADATPVDAELITAAYTEAGDRQRAVFRHTLAVALQQSADPPASR